MNHIRLEILMSLFLGAICSMSGQDRFAEIGARAYKTREHLLSEPQPPVLPDIDLPLEHDPGAAFRPVNPMDSKEELDHALSGLRTAYAPYLRNMAPGLPAMRKRTFLDSFDWREETSEDVKDFLGTLSGKGSWEKVTIPHYGPPLGRAVTYYTTEFTQDEDQPEDQLLYLHFKGVDYKASVFVNGNHIGGHEGFFAPFEFEISDEVHRGKNRLLVRVENDFTTTGNKDDQGNKITGDKIYGATGPGYDEPELGWHHCPPGMGIFQDCYLETRSALHINDVFVRPLPADSITEVWVEVNNMKEYPENIRLSLDIYGLNFSDTAVCGLNYIPSTVYIPGVGDLAKPQDWQRNVLSMEFGTNYLRIPVHMGSFRWWDPDHPWLYQVQIRLMDENGVLRDTREQQFGMRSFTMDTLNIPKGNLYLNDTMIRLRGANTMGHLQQCVIQGDLDQLIDDILLAHLCNMNFLRFTQRPAQKEIYEMCDRLGMLNQTDLPLFGSIRRNKVAEAVKQAEEMERLIRPHPSAIMVTYINERFPNAEGKPHRSLATAWEYDKLFQALDQAILLSNPDRVIKAGDGDYDPPSPGLPDNHCYNLWYNGHALSVGKMYKGYWQPVKPGWNYSCGEFGTEGLDPADVMYSYYPESWLPAENEVMENWDPSRISMAQSKRFHYMWYNTPGSFQDWITASQDYQAWATKFTTEAFRRDARMVSFAIHLFIDAWPGGWMKSIMDVDRRPKKAFFAYRNALEPLMVSIRSDRWDFYGGEESAIELWIANDQNIVKEGVRLHYQLEQEDTIVFAHSSPANIPVNSSAFQGFIRYTFPEVEERTAYVLRASLITKEGRSLHQNALDIEVFPGPVNPEVSVFAYSLPDGPAAKLIKQANLAVAASALKADVLIADNYRMYEEHKKGIDRLVKGGKQLLFLELPEGNYEIGESMVRVKKTEMGDYYFVSPQTGHSLLKNYQSDDFRFWHDASTGYITPLLSYTFEGEGWDPVLISGSSNWVTDKGIVLAAAGMQYGKGMIRICEVILPDHLETNPVAYDFLMRMLHGAGHEVIVGKALDGEISRQ